MLECCNSCSLSTCSPQHKAMLWCSIRQGRVVTSHKCPSTPQPQNTNAHTQCTEQCYKIRTCFPGAARIHPQISQSMPLDEMPCVCSETAAADKGADATACNAAVMCVYTRSSKGRDTCCPGPQQSQQQLLPPARPQAYTHVGRGGNASAAGPAVLRHDRSPRRRYTAQGRQAAPTTSANNNYPVRAQPGPW